MPDNDKRYFEDLEEGMEVDCGSIEVSREEMLEFSERYDPQPIHIDEEAASESMYGDIIASGWLTCALSARLLVKEYMNKNAMLGGRGMDELRWHKPVYAGDTLNVSLMLEEKYSGDNQLYGHTRENLKTMNQHGDVVLSMTGLGLVEKRNG